MITTQKNVAGAVEKSALNEESALSNLKLPERDSIFNQVSQGRYEAARNSLASGGNSPAVTNRLQAIASSQPPVTA